MKKLIFTAVALLIFGGCTKIEQTEESYFVEVTHQEGNTKVVLRAFEPTMVEIDIGVRKDTLTHYYIPIGITYKGLHEVKHRKIENVIWAH